jgi:subtilisin family serine protease
MNNMNRNLLRTTFGAMLMLCVNLLLAQTPKIQGQKAHQAQTLAPQPQHAPMKPQQSNLPVQRAVVQTKSVQAGTKDVTPGKILIKMKAGAPFTTLQKRITQLSLNTRAETFQTGIGHLDAVARQFKAIKMVRIFPNAGKMEAKQHKYGLDRWYALQVDNATEISTAVNSFKAVTEVETVQPAYVIKSIASPIKKISGTIAKPLDAGSDTPPVNDPYYWLQWHYHNTGQEGGYTGADIDLEPAWKINAGKPNVIVDVVDEGVDYKHEDLAANMWVNLAELNGLPGVDDDGNGYIDDIHGYNFGDNSSTIIPGDHGTHTSGTIAAVNNNGIGVCGVAGGTGVGDGARIMSSEIFGTSGADGAGTAAAIVYGANNGAVISQNSWGYTVPGVYDQAVLDAVDYFSKEAGLDANGNQVGPMYGGVVIFAAGNDNNNDLYYPGYYPSCVAVGATTVFDNKAAYSNYGDWVDISAPGGGDDVDGTSHQMVASTVANNGYGYMEGTSMATPHVSGVAALIVSQFGKMGFTNDDLKNRLFHSVRPFIAMDPNYNGLMGVGGLDAGKALQTDKGIPPVTISDLKGISNAQNSIDLNWTAPADQDNGNADSYIIYYSKTPFNESNKNAATKIFIKKALAAGSPESYNIGGLTPSTIYYINVSAKDLWGNESSLSNSVIVTTKDGPVISLPTDTLRMTINVPVNPAQSTSFKLTNSGTGTMNWTGSPIPVSSSWARQDGGFNDTLRRVDQDYTYYFIGDDQRVDFSAATRFDVTGKPFNLTHVGTVFQTSGVTAPITVYIYKGGSDPSQGTLLLKQTLVDPIIDYTFTPTKLNGSFLFKPGDWFWIVYQYDPMFGFTQGAEYGAPDSLANDFFVSSDKGKSWVTLNSVLGPTRFFMYALSNEGYPGSLISLLPNSGNLAGLSATTIAANGNATTIRNGVYNFNLQISSNDLNTPMTGVPMVITVKGQKGTLTSKEGILDTKSVFIGKDGDASIMLYNAGLSTLKKFVFKSDNNKFSLVSMPDTLNPGDSSRLTIRFTPTAAGQQLAKITVTTSDGILKLSGAGVGVNPPVMKLSKMPIQIVAKVDSVGKNTFTISNKTGKYPLSFSMPEIAAITKLKLKAKTAKGNDPSLDYGWIDSNEPDGPVYSWDDISTTGREITQQLAADVKTSALYPLGFKMKFYGDTISQIYVNSFGSLSLNYPGAMNVVSCCLPTPNDGLNGLIAGLFLEYYAPVVNTNEHVFVKTLPGKFIVQYNDLEYFSGYEFGGSFSAGKATFQIVLYSNGKIEMNYKTVNNTWGQQYALIGLESKDETKGINIAVSPDFIQPAPFVVADNTTLWWVPSAPKFITSIFPSSGAVSVGDSVKITVTASAAGLIDSTYNTSIALTTNDPLQEKVDLPVIFTVTGIQGMMKKTDTLAFGKVYKNATAKIDAVFLNTGTKPVNLLKTAFSNGAYTTDQGPVSVPALSELHIPVTFAPTAEKSYPGVLTVTTDDSAKAVFTVVLTGNGIATPSMTYALTGGQTNTLNIGQTLPASLKVTNNGDGDLKIMVEHPQWFVMNQAGQGVGNGLDSAHTYSIHKSMDSSTAAYNWVELANGLGTGSILSPQGIASQEIKLPFVFQYYGKTYQSLFIDWMGNVTLNKEKTIFYARPTIPSPLDPNGVIVTANHPFAQGYDYQTGKMLGQIYYYTDNEKMIVEFYGMWGGNFNDNGPITFETIFYKDGRIKMLYQSGELTTNYTQDFLVGIENEDGTDGSLAFNQTLWYKDHGAIEYVPSIPYTLKPGKSVDLPASWTTTSMTNGVYKDYLTIISNDPRLSSVHIPIELDVKGPNTVKTSDTVTFGKVVAYTSPNSVQNTYNQPVLIKNNGTQNITISNIDFSNNSAFTLDELNAYPGITYPLVLAPGDELKYHITFTPIPSMSTVNEFVNINSDYPTPIAIPISATVIQPPVVTTDSTAIHVVLQQTDSIRRFIQLGNAGLGDLDYNLSLEYHRPGIAYNSVKPVVPVKNAVTKRNVFSLYGSGQNTQIYGSGGSTVGYPGAKFADSILAFDPVSGRQYIDFLGTGVDEPSVMAVSRFNGGKKGFYLSHVATLYRTDNMIPATIKFRIRLGSNINNSTVVYEQSVLAQPDTTGTGTYLIAKMDSSILINAYEDFWIEWDYAFGMRFPQAFQYVTSDQFKPQTFYYRATESDAFREIYWAADFYMGAYAQTDSAGGWLTFTPDNGTVGINKKQKLTLTAHGPKVTPPDQSADLIIRSSDPATPEYKVGVFVHIDQAPVLTNHDTLFVHEADSLNSLIPAQDDENGKVKVKLISKDKAASVKTTDSGSYFIYKPGYDDAGLHMFTLSLTDLNGNKRNDSLIVLVINTNRPPVVVKHLKRRTISLDGPALSLALDTVFMDPDGDALTYGYTGETSPLAQVFVKPTGETGIIQKDTGHVSLPFIATDINGASGYDTLELYIKNNKAPVSSGIPYVFIEKGLTQILDLSNYFSDEDPGDVLSYSATVDSSKYASIEVHGSNLIIHGLSVGECIVTVTADDGSGGTVSKSFIVEVVSKMGDSGYDYHIRVAPNPIHGIAAALFLMDKEKRVQIQLLNMDGRVRQTLFEGIRPAGFNTVSINLHGVPMGNYYLKFTLGTDIRVVQITKL